MIKKFDITLSTLLLVMHGTTLSMLTTKTFRIISLPNLNRNVHIQSPNQAAQSTEITQALRDIEKKLEEQNKILQANLEVKTVEVECKIRNSYYMDYYEREELRERFGKISGVHIKK